MFTIPIYVRFAAIAVCLVGGAIAAFTIGFWWAFPFLLIGILLIVGYILLGTVQSAGELLQQADIEGAEKRLQLTWKPEWLFSVNRAAYYILRGTLATYRKDVDEAEKWLLKADAIDIPTANEKAIVQLQLSNVYASRNKWKQAEVHFKNAKQIEVTDPNIKAQIKEFEKVFSQNKSQLQTMSRMGYQKGMMMQPGGKRRRPKMR